MSAFAKEPVRQFGRGFWRGAILSVAVILPFTIAAKVGLSWMFLASAAVIVAAGTLLAYRLRMYPFNKEKENHW